MNASPNLMLGSMIALSLVCGLIGLVVMVLFLLSLQKCLKRVTPANRTMEPGMVWLNLVPLLNLFWEFYTIIKIAESTVKDGQARSLDVGDGAKTVGLAFCILGLCSLIPFVNLLAGPAALICFIIYWVKIVGISGKLAPAAAPAA